MCGFAPLRSSTTSRMPPRPLDSFFTFCASDKRLERMSSATFSATREGFTWYGTSVTTSFCRPFESSSMVMVARIRMEPRPVMYASLMPSRPMIEPPVGKSGPLMCFMSCATVMSG